MAGVTAATPPVLANVRTSAGHTIGVEHLRELLAHVRPDAGPSDYVAAVVEANLLGRRTHAGRKRVLRHLRELYLLDPARPEFHAMRTLWVRDATAQPLLAGLLAFSRDELFRASFGGLPQRGVSRTVSSADFAGAVAAVFPHGMSPATLAKIGRNTSSSWSQTGHLAGSTSKVRRVPGARPVSAAFALLLGYLDGARGALLLDTPWTAVLDVGREELDFLVADAAGQGLLDHRAAGGVVEIGFPHLLRDLSGAVA